MMHIVHTHACVHVCARIRTRTNIYAHTDVIVRYTLYCTHIGTCTTTIDCFRKPSQEWRKRGPLTSLLRNFTNIRIDDDDCIRPYARIQRTRATPKTTPNYIRRTRESLFTSGIVEIDQYHFRQCPRLHALTQRPISICAV